MKSHGLSLLCCCLLLFSCRQTPEKRLAAALPEKTAVDKKDTAAEEPKNDSSYLHFLQALISDRQIQYLPDTLNISQHAVFIDDSPIPQRDSPTTLVVNGHRYRERQINFPQGGQHDFSYQAYDIDSTAVFLFRGRKYGWATGSYFMCNGSGCAYRCYLLYDYQTGRLHFLDHFAALSEAEAGDVNGDAVLDILLPGSNPHETPFIPDEDRYSSAQRDSIYAHLKNPYSLEVYSLDARGDLRPLKSPAGRRCTIQATFTNDRWEPRNFTLSGQTCFSSLRGFIQRAAADSEVR